MRLPVVLKNKKKDNTTCDCRGKKFTLNTMIYKYYNIVLNKKKLIKNRINLQHKISNALFLNSWLSFYRYTLASIMKKTHLKKLKSYVSKSINLN